MDLTKQVDNKRKLSAMGEGLVHELTWHRCLILFAGLTLVVFYAGFRPSAEPNWLLVGKSQENANPNKWRRMASWDDLTTRAAAWEKNSSIHDDDPNWRGRERMRDTLVNGALWWDAKAEQYFISRLEESQFPPSCSEAHWVAHYEFVAGLMSSVHVLQQPLFFSMVRGHTLVPISNPGRHPAFDGCRERNAQCFFNITNCRPEDDRARFTKIQSMKHDRDRTTWDELLMEEDDFFPPKGVTVVKALKWDVWSTKMCVGSSSFSSVSEAYGYYKLDLWNKMRSHGRGGVMKGLDVESNKSRACKGYNPWDPEIKRRRMDMVMTSLMSSWMLNRMPDNVKQIADKIMSRYIDASGQPAWRPPVLGIHVRQTDKSSEDPYYKEHGIFRPIEDYVVHMKRIEQEHGFQFQSVFLISDSGTAMESLMTLIKGNATESTPSNQGTVADDQRTIIYDWTINDHLQDEYKEHAKVPKPLKYDMQTHFLATLYIMQKIADHAIVTYSSNVGRFIGEVMAARHRLAFPEANGPVVTSLDYPWFWA